jgi:hypothetical protein
MARGAGMLGIPPERNPMQDPQMPPPYQPLEPAPGAKAATQLGIWSLVSNVLCGCFPLAIGLGIGALVKHGKAKRAAEAEPTRYETPSNTGLVTGIIGIVWTIFALAYIGIISAIAIPALLGQREHARERVIQGYVAQAKAEAVLVADTLPKGPDGQVDPEAVVKTLMSRSTIQNAQTLNPYAPGHPVFVEGDEPTEDGQIALKGGFTQDGQNHPAIQIRARTKRNGRSQVSETLVTLD